MILILPQIEYVDVTLTAIIAEVKHTRMPKALTHSWKLSGRTKCVRISLSVFKNKHACGRASYKRHNSRKRIILKRYFGNTLHVYSLWYLFWVYLLFKFLILMTIWINIRSGSNSYHITRTIVLVFIASEIYYHYPCIMMNVNLGLGITLWRLLNTRLFQRRRKFTITPR